MKKSLVLPVIILLLTTAVFSIFVFAVKAKSQTVVKYDAYSVKSGDTLWNIAKLYNNNNGDIRRVVYDIMIENDMATPDLYPGQVLNIPVGD